MLEQIHEYFSAEKSESLVFIAGGLTALVAGGFFLFRGAFFKGFACPLIIVALIQLVVGTTVYLRTDRQVAALVHQLETEPEVYRQQELQRMEVVNRNFDLYKLIEIALLAAGIAVAIAGFASRRRFLLGAGCGLTLQSGFMRVLDFFAEARADVYTSQLLGL